MSSKTPNDILRRKAVRPESNSLHKTSSPLKKTHYSPSSLTKPASTRLKDMFINSKEREELMTACAKGDIPKVTHLLQEKKVGLNPDLIRDSKMRTPLLVACAAGQAAIVRQLIRYGADVNNPTGDIVGNKPLDLAVISNDVDTVLALLEAGAKVAAMRDTLKGHPLTTRMKAAARTPLDLANARLDMLIRQTEQTGSIHSATIEQVIKIIQLLKHFVPPSQEDSLANELDELTSQISSMQLEQKGENKEDDKDIFVMKSLRDVISKIQLN